MAAGSALFGTAADLFRAEIGHVVVLFAMPPYAKAPAEPAPHGKKAR